MILVGCFGLSFGIATNSWGALVTPELQVTSSVHLVDSQLSYLFGLNFSDVNENVTYILERQLSGQPETKIQILESIYQEMKAGNFKFYDNYRIVKHGVYQYLLYTLKNGEKSAVKTVEARVANLEPKNNVTGPPENVTQLEVNFALGKIRDDEGDQLEYRLYTRIPGSNSRILRKTWNPTTDNQQVSFTFPQADYSSYEWMIMCIEADSNIYDRKEIQCMQWWGSLTINTRDILIRCYNNFGMFQYGTKKQPLRFKVEKNPDIYLERVVWNFGDGTPTQTGTEVTHVYNQLTAENKPYIVKVTAVDDWENEYTNELQIWIVNTSKGRLYTDETWEGVQVLAEEVIVPNGITLTIKPGTKVQARQKSILKIEGNLLAEDASQGIQFASQEGTLIWQGIKFQGQGQGRLMGLKISEAERGIAAAGTGELNLSKIVLTNNQIGLHCYSGQITMDNCSFLNNQVYGVKEDHQTSPVLKNCLFQGNGIAYYDETLLHLSSQQLNTGDNEANIFK